jgi:hypothetical protein
VSDGVDTNLLPWGVLVGLAVMLRAELLEVPAKVWQRAVLPTAAKKVDYDDLARELTAFATGQAEQDLLRVPRPERTHALDAVGIGLFVALTSGATRITEGW